MRCVVATLFLFVALGASAQTQKPMASAAKSTSATSSMPTNAEVSEFLRRMFGYDPKLTWTIQGIVATEAPGVSHVVAAVMVGGQPRPIHLYVLPGGKFAVVGDYIPYGRDPFATVRATLAAKANGAQRGPAGASVTLVEFSDLQCPFCKAAQPVIDRLAADFPHTRLVFQSFPLPMHPWAMKAAAYAECSSRQKPEAFWAFVNSVYADQSNITDANIDSKLTGIAASAGVDALTVSACAETAEIHARIQQSIELGRSVGVNSTPTLFINGRKVAGISDVPYEQLKAMVAFEIAEAEKKN